VFVAVRYPAAESAAARPPTARCAGGIL